MGVIPPSKADLLTFCEAHVPVWIAAPTSIGLTAAQATSFDAATKLMRNKQIAAETARNASKAATLTYDDATDALRDLVGLLVKTIKLYADNNANPEAVYAAAQIPAPSAPTPNPPPGQPTNFKFELESGGLLTMRWKSENSAASGGAYFSVARRFGGEGLFTMIGGTSAKVFTDDSIPLGAGSVSYIVTPRRSGVAGTPSDLITVQFGVGGGQSLIVSRAPSAGYQIAA